VCLGGTGANAAMIACTPGTADLHARTLTMANLEMGFILPNVPDNLIRKAFLLESLGFEQLGCGEHIAFHGPVPNSLIRLAHVAAVTTNIRLLAGVVTVPLYPPVLLAKLATEVDVLSEGRLVLGVGVAGEYPPEFDAVGVSLRERGSRTDEGIEVLQHLWRGISGPFEGRYTTFDGIRILPGPVQNEGPPIWVAGRGAAAVKRAARFGQVWMPYLYSPRQLADSVRLLGELTTADGRDPDEIGVWPSCFINCNVDSGRATAEAVAAIATMYNQPFDSLAAKYFVTGTPEECAERICAYQDAGADGMMLFAACSVDQYEDQVRMVAETVRPIVQSMRS
jgi:probable F420-dependent oxidoreductase